MELIGRKDMDTGLIFFIMMLLMVGFGGNMVIISAVHEGDMSAISEMWILVLLGIVDDIILLYFVLKKLHVSVIPSFRLARNGLKNRRMAKKESAKLKKFMQNEKLYVNRLQVLRDKGISESAIKQTFRFCQLIETIAGKEQLQDCLSEINKRQNVLDEIRDIESRILKIAESYKNVGDTEKCRFYLDILRSTNKIKPEITALENECKVLLYSRDAERKAIRLWRRIFLGALAVFVMVSVVLYVEDTPYRKLRSMIKDQTLTAEMCSLENRYSEESCYDYLASERGRKLLASELTKLHRDDDINKAMWLLCIQPDCINGYGLCASPSFINWIVDYAKTNGVRSTDPEGISGLLHYVIYTVDGYQIVLSSNYDDMSVVTIGGFDISDGNSQISVQIRSKDANGTIPTIE